MPVQEAKPGDKVKVHYTGRLDDGTVFDSSVDATPIEFEVGGGQVIVGFDRGVTGMKVGDRRTVDIPADDAYGPHHPEAVLNMPREQFPPDLELAPGLMLRMQHPSGAPIDMTVMAFNERTVTLDANHPLAGQTLHFDLELVAIG
jgi:peptidylprolyl isomerase